MRRTVTAVLILTILLALVGCASDAEERTRQENGVSPQWPPAPQAARINYLYSLTTPADVEIGRSWFGKAWQFIKGKQDERIARPQGIHVDPDGRLYVVDTQKRKVHVFDSGSSRYFSFPAKPIAHFEFPIGITADGKGRVYVSDALTKRVHVFDSFGKKYVTSIGSEQLMRPTGLALRSGSKDLLVVDTVASKIIVFDTDRFSVRSNAGYDGTERDALHYPTNIVQAKDGSVYVTDALNFRIQKLSSELEFLGHFGEAGDGPGSFSRPKGVAVDSDNNIYVVDALFDNVQIFNRNGDLLLAFGTAGHAAGEFWLPNDIFIDNSDHIYVSDSYNSRVQVFEYLSEATQ